MRRSILGRTRSLNETVTMVPGTSTNRIDSIAASCSSGETARIIGTADPTASSPGFADPLESSKRTISYQRVSSPSTSRRAATSASLSGMNTVIGSRSDRKRRTLPRYGLGSSVSATARSWRLSRSASLWASTSRTNVRNGRSPLGTGSSPASCTRVGQSESAYRLDRVVGVRCEILERGVQIAHRLKFTLKLVPLRRDCDRREPEQHEQHDRPADRADAIGDDLRIRVPHRPRSGAETTSAHRDSVGNPTPRA